MSVQPAKIAPAIPRFQFMQAIRQVREGISRRAGSALARFAAYNAANATPTTTVGNRYATNPNSTMAQIARVALNWTGEDVAKNSPIAACYLETRRNYCSSQITYTPDTGDSVLDAELKEYLAGVWAVGGIGCSMQEAFSRAADVELPVRGDSGLIWYRDTTQLRLMEFSADQLGELYTFTAPRYDNDGLMYFAGISFWADGQRARFRVYERGFQQVYTNPREFDACDVIYFQDNLFRGIRGVTKFATAIQHMEKGERLFQIGMDAALRQAKTAFAVFNNRGAPDENTYDNRQLEDGEVIHRQRINDGPQVEYFYTGDSVQDLSVSRPGDPAIQGCEFSDERVSLALGFPYAFLINATKVGGAPSRLEINKATKEIERIQNVVHRPRLDMISSIFILDAVDRGHFPAVKNITRGRWSFPIVPTVDAFRDGKEDINMMRAGLESAQNILARTNQNTAEILRANQQWAVDVAKAVENGNRQLKADGFQPTITAADIAQVSDNPLQAQQAEQLTEGRTTTGIQPNASQPGTN